MDVSADLTELGRTPIAVVSAGIKSILDIGRTLEYLETQVTPLLELPYCLIQRELLSLDTELTSIPRFLLLRVALKPRAASIRLPNALHFYVDLN